MTWSILIIVFVCGFVRTTTFAQSIFALHTTPTKCSSLLNDNPQNKCSVSSSPLQGPEVGGTRLQIKSNEDCSLLDYSGTDEEDIILTAHCRFQSKAFTQIVDGVQIDENTVECLSPYSGQSISVYIAITLLPHGCSAYDDTVEWIGSDTAFVYAGDYAGIIIVPSNEEEANPNRALQQQKQQQQQQQQEMPSAVVKESFKYDENDTVGGKGEDEENLSNTRVLQKEELATAQTSQCLGSNVWEPVGSPINGENERDFTGLISISDDATTIAVSAPGWQGGNGKGRVSIFQLTNNSPQLVETIDGTTNSESLGYSVALSSDGTVLALGTPFANTGFFSGAVEVYEYDAIDSEWKIRGQRIQNTNPNENLGFSIALSSDGTFLLVGAPGIIGNSNNDDDFASSATPHGYIEIYRYETSEYEASLTHVQNPEIEDWYGFAVTADDEMDVIAVNAPNLGKVYIYHVTGVMKDQLQLQQTFNIADESGFGTIALTSNGDTIAIGTPYSGQDQGEVQVFKYDIDNDSWDQLGQSILGATGQAHEGEYIDLVYYQNVYYLTTAAINDNSVRTFKYDDNTGDWIQYGNTIEAHFVFNQPGTCVALSQDAQILVVGSPSKDLNSADFVGQVVVYQWCGDGQTDNPTVNDSLSPSTSPTFSPTTSLTDASDYTTITTGSCEDLQEAGGEWRDIESVDECLEANQAIFGKDPNNTYDYSQGPYPWSPCGCTFHQYGTIDFWGIESYSQCSPTADCTDFRPVNPENDLGCFCRRTLTTPSTNPSLSMLPSSNPTDSPSTKSPTSLPTNSPSNQSLTLSPSNSPTSSLSILPSSNPTDSPITHSPTTHSPSTQSPTAFPSYSPTSTLTTSPTSPCVDDPTFETAEIKSCKWVRNDEDRRQEICSLYSAVRIACPLACGECCEDDASFTFINDFDKEQDCTFIAKLDDRAEKWCKEYLLDTTAGTKTVVRAKCPKACDFCFTPVAPTTAKPSVAPTIEPTFSPTTSSPTITCVNNPTFRSIGDKEFSCTGISANRKRRKRLCAMSSVHDACPVTCGVCCADDASFTFTTDAGKIQNCIWLAKNTVKQTKYCDKNNIKIRCARTCENCQKYVSVAPSVAPTTSPTQHPTTANPTITCANDKNFRYEGKASNSCTWISNKPDRRKWLCAKSSVHDACPVTCGVCCADDASFSFKTDFDEVKVCKWIAKKTLRINKYCEKVKIKIGCAETCGNCQEYISVAPSVAPFPTPGPTFIPSLSPTSIPTTSPSITPTNFPTFTSFPTSKPTTSPTSIPTTSPTSTPTTSPTSNPSISPSSNPTSISPTSSPTTSPTSKPTTSPTSIPTTSPTSNPPTSTPTTSPTSTPTTSPTITPTTSPTFVPTTAPTFTTFPTSKPTIFPTFNPTNSPTSNPTGFPTTTPTTYPTAFPTFHPTSTPTTYPSSPPTTIPSAQPSSTPSLVAPSSLIVAGKPTIIGWNTEKGLISEVLENSGARVDARRLSDEPSNSFRESDLKANIEILAYNETAHLSTAPAFQVVQVIEISSIISNSTVVVVDEALISDFFISNWGIEGSVAIIIVRLVVYETQDSIDRIGVTQSSKLIGVLPSDWQDSGNQSNRECPIVPFSKEICPGIGDLTPCPPSYGVAKNDFRFSPDDVCSWPSGKFTCQPEIDLIVHYVTFCLSSDIQTNYDYSNKCQFDFTKLDDTFYDMIERTDDCSCSTFHPGAVGCVRNEQSQCCYSKSGALITQAEDGGGTAKCFPTDETLLDTIGHFIFDVLPYEYCCILNDDCDSYYEARSIITDDGYNYPLPASRVFGDPHLTTFDDLDYDFNGFGEYVAFCTFLNDQTLSQEELLKYCNPSEVKRVSDRNILSVHYRFSTLQPEHRGTATVGIAIEDPLFRNGQHALVVKVNQDRNVRLNLYNGDDLVTFPTKQKGLVKLSIDGAIVSKTSNTKRRFFIMTIQLPSGLKIKIVETFGVILPAITRPIGIKNTIGLLGLPDGAKINDLTNSSGSVLEFGLDASPITRTLQETETLFDTEKTKDIFEKFGQTWMIQSQNASLFNEDFNDYFRTNYTPWFEAELGTDSPTTKPSTAPLDQPSVSPSIVPSIVRSTLPSEVPTDTSSEVPSVNPSTLPTDLPSASTPLPTSKPSLFPTSVSSPLPTNVPSPLPTSVSSPLPTSAPSSLPTSKPSSLPTSEPSSIPTSEPSSLPTSEPSSIPTSEPSAVPSSEHSHIPTGETSSSNISTDGDRLRRLQGTLDYEEVCGFIDDDFIREACIFDFSVIRNATIVKDTTAAAVREKENASILRNRPPEIIGGKNKYVRVQLYDKLAFEIKVIDTDGDDITASMDRNDNSLFDLSPLNGSDFKLVFNGSEQYGKFKSQVTITDGLTPVLFTVTVRVERSTIPTSIPSPKPSIMPLPAPSKSRPSQKSSKSKKPSKSKKSKKSKK